VISRRKLSILLAAALILAVVGGVVYRGEPVEMANCGTKAAAAAIGDRSFSAATAASSSEGTSQSSPAMAAAAVDAPPSPASGGSSAVPPVLPPTGGGGSAGGGPPRRSIAEVLEGVDYSIPGERERVVAELRAIEEADRMAAVARAQELGLPVRRELPDGRVQEVAGLDERGQLLYRITHNVNAAISTAANLVQAAPYSLTGTNLVAGVWDGGSVRATHQEFGGRVTVRDGSGSINHATHVGGTIAARGVTNNARGMATAARIDSYDWNSDLTEMNAAGAATATETNKMLVSNHSYGFISGWHYVNGGSPYRVWDWYGAGTGTSGTELAFGRYNTNARNTDATAVAVPFMTIFWSAGNDRNNNPSDGQSVALSPGSSTVVPYSSSSHPAGDGAYRNGYENISHNGVAKNVVVIGAVNDAVSGGQRATTNATMSDFSSWGPTDDGRIKPDLVANGVSVYSSGSGSDTAYYTSSGTSMASPNAAGSAVLVAQEYVRLSGQAMRSSTMRGLLIHTADDIGRAGPDYVNGWGLINTKAAVDLVRDHAANPRKARLTEGTMPTNGTTITHEFIWDGSSPIRATLCWTDPAGTSTTTSDLRSPRLRNNLDLKIIAPDGTQHLPYVMPFVGTWTVESMALPATTGVNNTDNVEQVYIASPPGAGVYRAVVSFQGTLANNQVYSLLISGSADETLPPPALQLDAVSPATANAGSVVTLQLSGISLAGVTSVQLTKDGQAAINATSLSMAGEQLVCQVNLTGAAAGTWNVAASKGAETAVLANAFTVVGTLYSETFDGTVTGWSSSAGAGAVPWVLTNAAAHSPTMSYFASGPAAKTTNALTSAAINVPANASNLQFKFWHSYDLEPAKDGGRLLISTNNGTAWFDADATNSGVSFAANGYVSTIAATGRPADRSEFAGQRAWSGNSGGFVETVLNLNDTAKFAGRTVRFRWVLATDAAKASPGWYVDSIVLTGGADLVNQPPAITNPATVPGAATFTDPADDITYSVVAAASAGLEVSATDDGGAAALTYTWSASGPGPVFFLPNGSTAAASTTADFESPGDYQINVTVTDAGGLSASSTVYVRVEASASAVRVLPPSASLGVGGTQQFGAVLLDQFGGEMDNSAALYTWSATGGGTVNSAGLFTATEAGENFAVVASTTLPNGTVFGALAADGVAADADASDFAQVTVTPGEATVSLANLGQTYDGLPKQVTVTTDPPDLSVSVAYNGIASAPAAPGTYGVEAVVTDPNYQGGASGTLTIQLSSFDAWRLEKFGENWETDPAAAEEADADGDGASNRAEFYLGTDPLDPGSRLRIFAEPLNSAAATVTIAPAVTAGIYTLKSWSDLTQEPALTDLPVASDAPSASFEVPAAADRNFYQLLYTPPSLP
jgi:hypothetical protein